MLINPCKIEIILCYFWSSLSRNWQVKVYQIKMLKVLNGNHLLLQFSATDKDYKENATLTYSITSGNGPFRIDSATGNVTVADPSRLDREVLDTLRLVVTVVDGGTTLSPNLRKSGMDTHKHTHTLFFYSFI